MRDKDKVGEGWWYMACWCRSDWGDRAAMYVCDAGWGHGG